MPTDWPNAPDLERPHLGKGEAAVRGPSGPVPNEVFLPYFGVRLGGHRRSTFGDRID